MLYPIFLNLENKLCVVVGAGKVAERRVRGLCNAGALVRVVGVDATDELQQLANQQKIELRQKSFASGDINACFLVMATTNDEGVNQEVQMLAEQMGVLFCGADHTTQSDFTVPAVVQQGDLQLAISTGGHSPAYAKLLRSELDAWVNEEHAHFLNLLAKLRPRVFEHFPDAPEQRQEFWRQLVTTETLALARSGQWDAIKEQIDSCLSS